MAEEKKTPGIAESYACRVCRATFANSSNRLRHLKRQHPGEYAASTDLHDDQTQSSGFVGLTIRQQVQAAMTSVLESNFTRPSNTIISDIQRSVPALSDREAEIALAAASTAVKFVHARHRDLTLLEVAGDQTRAKTDLARSLVYLSKGPTWPGYPSALANDGGRDPSSASSRDPSAVGDRERRVGDWVRAHNQPPPTAAALGVPPGGHEELPERPPADDAAPETGKAETGCCSSASSSSSGTSCCSSCSAYVPPTPKGAAGVSPQKDLQRSVAAASGSLRQQSPLPHGEAAKKSTINEAQNTENTSRQQGDTQGDMRKQHGGERRRSFAMRTRGEERTRRPASPAGHAVPPVRQRDDRRPDQDRRRSPKSVGYGRRPPGPRDPSPPPRAPRRHASPSPLRSSARTCPHERNRRRHQYRRSSPGAPRGSRSHIKRSFIAF